MDQDPLARIVLMFSPRQHDIDGFALHHGALTSMEAVRLEQKALIHLTSPQAASIWSSRSLYNPLYAPFTSNVIRLRYQLPQLQVT
jgi:hypothetical protein